MTSLARLLVLVFALNALHITAQAGGWDGANNPAIFGVTEYNLEKLPLEAKLDRLPWSETYWPTAKGGINIRWNSPNPVGFDYASPTREQVKRMTKAQLAELAPTEKYDILMGNYNYPLKADAANYASPRAKWWAGFCHGWSPAALQFVEPQPVELVNPDGVVVPFGASDVKGLMSFGAAIHNELDPVQVGLKCNPAGWTFQTAKCEDVNAGALHVILGNQIGLMKEGFVIQRDPRGQIWNQPTYGYKFEIVGSAATDNKAAARAVRVTGTLYYTDELEHSLWQSVTGTDQFVEGKMELDYNLELDAAGNIVGGSWNNRMHPDFLWKPTKKIEYTGILEGLNRIYKPVGQN